MRALLCSRANEGQIRKDSGLDFFSRIVLVDDIAVEWRGLRFVIDGDFESVFIDTQSLNECGVSPEPIAWAITQLLRTSAHPKVFVDEYSRIYFQNIKSFADALVLSQSSGSWFALSQNSAALLQAETVTISTEDAGLAPTGGIGTFNWHLRKISGGRVGSIVIEAANPKEERLSSSNGVVQYSGKLGSTLSEPELGEFAIKAVLQVLAIGPNIKGVVIQDYQSLGFRITQARASGLLPPWLSITVVMHGQVDYLLNANGDWPILFGNNEAFEAIRTQYILREADSIIFPSNFLRSLLLKTYEIDNSKTVTLPLPYDLDVIEDIAPEENQGKFDLIYIGKPSAMKGWPVIEELLSGLRQESQASLLRILLLMPHTSGLAWKRQYKLSIEQRFVRNRDLLSTSKSNPSALYLLPHAFENYPYAFLEQVLLGNRILTLRQGGGWELIQRFEDAAEANAIGARDSEEFLKIAKENLNHESLTPEQKARVWSLQKRFNEAFLDHVLSVSTPSESNDFADLPTLDVVTPVYNTSSDHLNALERSLAEQGSQLSTWIIVDDGSSARGTLNAIDRLSDLPWARVVKQANRGLSAARNRGLEEVRSKVVLFMDSDDICLPRMLRAHRLAHHLNPSYAAFGGISAYVPSDDLDRGGEISAAGRFAPLGTDLAAHLQFFGYNQYLTANSSFSTAVCGSLLRFNAERSGVWEDWEIFHKLALTGLRIGLIPQELFIYRVRADSMTRSESRKLGIERMVASQSHPLQARIAMSIAVAAYGRSNNSSLVDLHPIAAFMQRIADAHENRMLGRAYRGMKFAARQISRPFRNVRN